MARGTRESVSALRSPPDERAGAFCRSGYDGAMATFTLDGTTYEYLRPDPGHDPEDAHSWTYGQPPKVMATLPLAVGTADVYAVAERWNPSHILVSWQDDEHHARWASATSPTPNGTSKNTVAARKICAPCGGATGSRVPARPEFFKWNGTNGS